MSNHDQCVFCHESFDSIEEAINHRNRNGGPRTRIFRKPKKNNDGLIEIRIVEKILSKSEREVFAACVAHTRAAQEADAKASGKPVNKVKVETQVKIKVESTKPEPEVKSYPAPNGSTVFAVVKVPSPKEAPSCPVLEPTTPKAVTPAPVPTPEEVAQPAAVATVHPCAVVGVLLLHVLRFLLGLFCLVVIAMMLHEGTYQRLCGKAHAGLRDANVLKCNTTAIEYSNECSWGVWWVKSAWNWVWGIDHEVVCANLKSVMMTACSNTKPDFVEVLATCMIPISSGPVSAAWEAVTSFFFSGLKGVATVAVVINWSTPEGVQTIWRATRFVSGFVVRFFGGRRQPGRTTGMTPMFVSYPPVMN